MAMITCHKCGTQFPDTEAICPRCGARVPDAAAGVAAVAEKTPRAGDAGQTGRVKKLLVLVLGCLAWTAGIFRQGFSLGYALNILLEVAIILQYTAMYGAMIVFHWKEDKTPAKVLALAGAMLTVLQTVLRIILYINLYNIPFDAILTPRFLMQQLAGISQGILLAVYALTERKGKNNIVWLILYVCLFIWQMAVSSSSTPMAILHMIHVFLFFSVGYSPNKWYGGRRAAPADPPQGNA